MTIGPVLPIMDAPTPAIRAECPAGAHSAPERPGDPIQGKPLRQGSRKGPAAGVGHADLEDAEKEKVQLAELDSQLNENGVKIDELKAKMKARKFVFSGEVYLRQ